VCSPAMARRLARPEDLYAAPIIRYENAQERWEDWGRSVGLTEPLPEGLTFSEAALCMNAAMAGVGVALGWDILLAEELRDGRLVRPFDSQMTAEYSLWFVTARAQGHDPKIGAFKTWIRRQLAG